MVDNEQDRDRTEHLLLLRFKIQEMEKLIEETLEQEQEAPELPQEVPKTVTSDTDELLDLRTISMKTGIQLAVFRRQIHKKKLEGVKIGNSWAIYKSEINRYLRKNGRKEIE